MSHLNDHSKVRNSLQAVMKTGKPLILQWQWHFLLVSAVLMCLEWVFFDWLRPPLDRTSWNLDKIGPPLTCSSSHFRRAWRKACGARVITSLMVHGGVVRFQADPVGHADPAETSRFLSARHVSRLQCRAQSWTVATYVCNSLKYSWFACSLQWQKKTKHLSSRKTRRHGSHRMPRQIGQSWIFGKSTDIPFELSFMNRMY